MDEYKIYFAQSLYKAGMYPEAMRAAVRVDNPQYAQRMLTLQVSQPAGHAQARLIMMGSRVMKGWCVAVQSAIKYELDELSACKSLLDQCLQDDPQTIINYAAISFKEVSSSRARRRGRRSRDPSCGPVGMQEHPECLTLSPPCLVRS